MLLFSSALIREFRAWPPVQVPAQPVQPLLVARGHNDSGLQVYVQPLSDELIVQAGVLNYLDGFQDVVSLGDHGQHGGGEYRLGGKVNVHQGTFGIHPCLFQGRWSGY